MTSKPVNCIMCGTGEYTTGFVNGAPSKSDKKIGVVALAMFELRRLGRVASVGMVGTAGKKFPDIRRHLVDHISSVYNNLDVSASTFPADDVDRDPLAYKAALSTLSPGDIVTIFTPDDTHFAIAKFAIERKLHVLVTKPAVKTLEQHQQLVALAREHGVLVFVEFHKRFDPLYIDARSKAQSIVDFAFFSSFMSQPKFQLETFKNWAGTGSDISYYLNSHHIDFHSCMVAGFAEPKGVFATKSTGVATSQKYACPEGTEDSITLTVPWQNKSGTSATAVYTASWAAPKADVHSQQRFHYMSHQGEIIIDQAHRGYTVCTDDNGFASVNPLYMSYSVGPDGNFAGHHAYGFKSISTFVEACIQINSGLKTAADFDASLPTLSATIVTTAILEAGRKSLDEHRFVGISKSEDGIFSLQ